MSAAPLLNSGVPPEIAAVEAKASGSSFYAAMRLMPRAEREAMFAIYAFCRAVDDIADDGIGTRPERHAALNAWRASMRSMPGARRGARHSSHLRCAITGCAGKTSLP